jgi:hypothetical protein
VADEHFFPVFNVQLYRIKEWHTHRMDGPKGNRPPFFSSSFFFLYILVPPEHCLDISTTNLELAKEGKGEKTTSLGQTCKSSQIVVIQRSLLLLLLLYSTYRPLPNTRIENTLGALVSYFFHVHAWCLHLSACLYSKDLY